MTLELVVFVALTLFGLAGSALFSGLETGVYCLSRVRLNLRAAGDPPDRAARLLKADIDHPSRTLATLLIGNNIFNYVGVWGLAAALQLFVESEVVVIALIALLFTPILLVVAESLPKELFRVGADRLTYRYVRYLWAARLLFTCSGVVPVVLLFDKVAAKLTGAQPTDAFGSDARSRIAALLKEGATLGALTDSQTSLIDRALTLREATVGEEMIPWRSVKCASASWNRKTLMDRVRAAQHARLPLIDKSGKVLGVLWNLDVYLRPEVSWTTLAAEPARLAPATPIRDALAALKESPAGVGIVEERGRPIGLITRKDLVEPLIGDVVAW
jgi:magnesium and cobalt exporter, CNNM family